MIQFTIPIEPTAQARARHTKQGRTYKCAKQKANERTLEALLVPHRPDTPIQGPVGIEIRAFMAIAKSKSKKFREAAIRGYERPTKKPDIDNILKQICDTMTRLQFWNDDVQVCHVAASKEYSEKPRWEITVEEI